MFTEEKNLSTNLQPTFDSDRPDPQLISACVHCGFCLATCPSYRVINKETDSPRGRIYLMDKVNKGEIPLSPAVVEHFDSCLGCLACVTTCPSGVQYDKLISNTRIQVERHHQRSLLDNLFRGLLFGILPYPNRLRLGLLPLFLYQKLGLQRWARSLNLWVQLLPKSLSAMESILPELKIASFYDDYPEVIPAVSEKRYRVGLIAGCVQRVFLPNINQATIRVLTANGCEVVIPPNQACCAAITHHQGQEEQTKVLARQVIDQFSKYDLDYVIINASGCGHTLKEYAHILRGDRNYQERAEQFSKKVKDVQEFLDMVGMTSPLHPISKSTLKIAYQDACHMLHGQKISLQPRRLLRQIPNVELREPIDAALCCGSAGIYNIIQSETADELGAMKVENLIATGADIIASANVGCTLQMQKHLRLKNKSIPIFHPVELLDYSICKQELPI
ncbi:MAG: (Fe-S)-binding protein [Pseudanabaenaceae cyanobacterium]